MIENTDTQPGDQQPASQAAGFGSHISDREVLVSVRNLEMHFPVTEGAIVSRVVAQVKAVDGISFDIRKGETLGLVGESGCGKTTTGRCILQLETPTGGEILYEGVNLNALSKDEMRPLRCLLYTSPSPRDS